MRFCTTQQTKVLLTLCTFLGCLLLSCSGFRESEEQRLRRRNRVREPLTSTNSDQKFAIHTPIYCQREKYPWEERYIGAYPRITKEFFRCRGNPTHPIRALPQEKGQPQKFADCEGGDKHGLPIIAGQEVVYPVLLELLNYVQEKTSKRVVVTSGHRCPIHNAYIDGSAPNQSSKHQVGAEVDFYVEEMENQPEAIVGLVKQYYKEHPSFAGKKPYTDFQHPQKKGGRESPLLV